MTNALEKISAVRKALAEVETLEDTLNIRDVASGIAVTAAAKQMKELADEAKEVQLRAERKAGEYLADMEKNTGQAGQFTGDTSVVAPAPPTLDDLGINNNQSSRWQKIARMPDAEFEATLAKIKAEEELTQAALLREVKQWIKETEQAEATRILDETLLPEHKDFDLSSLDTPEAAEVFAEIYNEREDKENIIKVAQTEGGTPSRLKKAVKLFDNQKEWREKLADTPAKVVLPEWTTEAHKNLLDTRDSFEKIADEIDKGTLERWSDPTVQGVLKRRWTSDIDDAIRALKRVHQELVDG